MGGPRDRKMWSICSTPTLNASGRSEAAMGSTSMVCVFGLTGGLGRVGLTGPATGRVGGANMWSICSTLKVPGRAAAMGSTSMVLPRKKGKKGASVPNTLRVVLGDECPFSACTSTGGECDQINGTNLMARRSPSLSRRIRLTMRGLKAHNLKVSVPLAE